MSAGNTGESVPAGRRNDFAAHGPDPTLTLLGVAAHGLAGSRIRPPSGLLDPAAWRGFVRACSEEHLVGLLAATIDAGILQVSDEQAADLETMVADVRAHSAALREAVVETCRTLDADGIDHHVLDGPVVAQRAYADPSVRDLDEVSILVDTSLLPIPSRQDAAVRFRHDLLPAELGQPVGLDDAKHHTTRVDVDGHLVPALPAEAQLVYTCAQAASASVADGLLALRDVAQLALTDDVDPVSVARFVGPGRVTAVVARAVRLAWQRFDLADKTRLSVWASRYDAQVVAGRIPGPRADGMRPGTRVGAVAQRITAALTAPVRKVGR